MIEQKIDSTYGLKLLKAGYKLVSKKNEHFSFVDGIIKVKDDNKSIKIDQYTFLDIYSTTIFYIDDYDSEECVDKTRDDEYYSWARERHT